jgi:hypothetical protein
VDDTSIQRKQEDVTYARGYEQELVVMRKDKIVDPEAGMDGADQRALGRPELDGGIFPALTKNLPSDA